ncbi:DUF943 family protein [Erwinia oleae]|uniref:DUF943 family protein n=1 Tax=Erwinia oleae TaxID=796334 RepID=UPI000692073E|nr:DUF943 family protein [Erwinia oleae]
MDYCNNFSPVNDLGCFFFYKISQPVIIVAVHKKDNFSMILVKNFPLTTRGKIDWWKENKGLLKNSYYVPLTKTDGSYHVSFLDFDKGYKEMPKSVPRLSSETADLLCFDDMSVKENCIEKNLLFRIHKNAYGVTYFDTLYKYYMDEGDGKLTEIKD